MSQISKVVAGREVETRDHGGVAAGAGSAVPVLQPPHGRRRHPQVLLRLRLRDLRSGGRRLQGRDHLRGVRRPRGGRASQGGSRHAAPGGPLQEGESRSGDAIEIESGTELILINQKFSTARAA